MLVQIITQISQVITWIRKVLFSSHSHYRFWKLHSVVRYPKVNSVAFKSLKIPTTCRIKYYSAYLISSELQTKPLWLEWSGRCKETLRQLLRSSARTYQTGSASHELEIKYFPLNCVPFGMSMAIFIFPRHTQINELLRPLWAHHGKG